MLAEVLRAIAHRLAEANRLQRKFPSLAALLRRASSGCPSR